MDPRYTWSIWLVLVVAAGVFIEILDAHSAFTLSSVSEAYALPLPHRVQFVAAAENPHLSGTSLVFVASNKGSITCYFRHPPQLLNIFSGESFSIRATLVLTPRGRLCVVDSMTYLPAGRDSNAS